MRFQNAVVWRDLVALEIPVAGVAYFVLGTLSFVTLSAIASSLVSNTNQVHFASVLAMDNSEMFYENASVRDDNVVSTVQGKLVEISEEVFARTFQLPVEGLIDIHEAPKDLIFDARTEFSLTGEQLSTSCKKRELKIEYRLLSDIVAKSITVKAGSFDSVTHERFLLMTAIFGDLELGDYEEFPPLKIFTAKIVGRYIAINDKIAVDSVEGLAGKSRVKKTPVKRAVSKRSPAAFIEEQVVKKKRTLKGKAAPSKAKLKLVPVALDAEPLQTVDPTSADDVDTIIEQVIAESAQLDTDVGSSVAPKADEMGQWLNLSFEEFIASDSNRIVDTASDTDGEP
ncbi:hypothetical protein F511_36295 [Dorcoceras hygrometricum]|uniref:Uncharacterized protein n=1 Tax=Dorcoceras hygrometricum TaxID=472368 RepID=A0A2Z7ACK6_9LAMI|nr:hypothetical protein F511_36295 [Dorcoceras hygrometricum]